MNIEYCIRWIPSKTLPIIEAPSGSSNMRDVLEAHGLVLSPRFRIFFKIN